jgi:DNA segregation ATPase FtsK/SpoIIIE, S-DNA-T family
MIPFKDQLERMFATRGVPCRINDARTLYATTELVIWPRSDVRFSKITSLQKDIEMIIGKPIVIRPLQGGAIIAYASDDRADSMPLSEFLDAVHPRTPSEFAIGVANDGSFITANLASPDVAHVGIFGATGSGKTNAMRCVVASLCADTRSSQIGLVLVDPKRRTNDAFMNYVSRHLLWSPCQTIEDSMQILGKVNVALTRRNKSLSRSSPSPRIVIVIDELAEMCVQGGNEFMRLVTTFTSTGREAGVHVVCATQYPTARSIGSLMRANLNLRLVGRMNSREEAKVAAGRTGSGAEALPGRGSFVLVSGDAMTPVTVPMFDLVPTREDQEYREPAVETESSASIEAVLPTPAPAQAVVVDDTYARAVRLLRQEPDISKSRFTQEVFGHPHTGARAAQSSALMERVRQDICK